MKLNGGISKGTRQRTFVRGRRKVKSGQVDLSKDEKKRPNWRGRHGRKVRNKCIGRV